jgi:hypothetical protein
MLQRLTENRATFDAMLGERAEKWNEATSSVDIRIVDNVERTLRSYKFCKQAGSALALLHPISEGIHHVESDDCKSSWVFPIVNAFMADCVKWSELAGDQCNEESKHHVIKAARDTLERAGLLVTLKADVDMFVWLVDLNTSPTASDPRADNILEAAGRFLTNASTKSTYRKLWRNSTRLSFVRENSDARQSNCKSLPR